MMSYEAFRDAIKQTIEASPNGALTWTEIRTAAKLPAEVSEQSVGTSGSRRIFG